MSEKTRIALSRAVAIILLASARIYVVLTNSPHKELISQVVTYSPIALSALTLGVLVWQAWISRVQAGIQRRQAETLPVLERSYIVVDVAEHGVAPRSAPYEGAVVAEGVFRLRVNNVGRTPAQITRIRVNFDIRRRGEIIDPIDPTTVGGDEMPIGTVATAGTPFIWPENLRGLLQALALAATPDGTPRPRQRIDDTFWVTGFVRYQDIFMENHILGFTFAYDAANRIYAARGNNKDYNYRRSERLEAIPPPS